jgi:hypothetical protein
MWADGLRVHASEPKRPRAAVVAGDEEKEDGNFLFVDSLAYARSVGNGDIYLVTRVRMQVQHSCNDKICNTSLAVRLVAVGLIKPVLV